MVLILGLLVLNLVGSIRSEDFQNTWNPSKISYPGALQLTTPTTHVAFQSIWGIWPRFLHFIPQCIHTSLKAGSWHTGLRDHSLGWHWIKHMSNWMLLQGRMWCCGSNWKCCSPEGVDVRWAWDITHDPRVWRLLSTTWIRASYEMSQ